MMDPDDLELFDRSLQQATASHTGEALDSALDEAGWRDALDVDPRAAVSLLFERQGAANVTSSAVDRVVLAALGVDRETEAGLVLPALGRFDPPGEVAGDGLRVRGLATSDLRRRDRAVVVAVLDDEHIAAVVDTDALALGTAGGIDPQLGLVRVTGGHVRAATRSTSSPTVWVTAVAAGQRALAHELVGSGTSDARPRS